MKKFVIVFFCISFSFLSVSADWSTSQIRDVVNNTDDIVRYTSGIKTTAEAILDRNYYIWSKVDDIESILRQYNNAVTGSDISNFLQITESFQTIARSLLTGCSTDLFSIKNNSEVITNLLLQIERNISSNSGDVNVTNLLNSIYQSLDFQDVNSFAFSLLSNIHSISNSLDSIEQTILNATSNNTERIVTEVGVYLGVVTNRLNNINSNCSSISSNINTINQNITSIKQSMNDILAYCATNTVALQEISDQLSLNNYAMTNLSSVLEGLTTNLLASATNDFSWVTNGTYNIDIRGNMDDVFYDNYAGGMIQYLWGDSYGATQLFGGETTPWDYVAQLYGGESIPYSIMNSFLYDIVLNYWSAQKLYDLYPILDDTRNTLTNKSQSVPYTIIYPASVTAGGGTSAIYSALTNAYLNSWQQQSDMTWFDRVEALLAALVFPDTDTSSSNVADADSAQSSAESQSDQFKDVLTSIQSTAFGSAKQQTQTTANTFTGFFTTLNSALTLNPPEALIIPVPNTPSDLDQSSGDLAWTVDFSSGGAKVALEFCRALSSFIVIVGFLFVVWKIGLLTFHVTLTISSLCFKTVQRILGK